MTQTKQYLFLLPIYKKNVDNSHYPLMRSWRTRKKDMQIAHAVYTARTSTLLLFFLYKPPSLTGKTLSELTLPSVR